MPVLDVDDFRPLVREHVRVALLTAYEAENPAALERRVREDPRAVAITILTWAADPGNETLRKLGDVTVDRKGQAAAWLARAQTLRADMRYEAHTTRRPAVGIVTGGVLSEPVFVVTPPGEPVNNYRDGVYTLDPERVF